jgi:uncharacterized membrane protein YcaP (DUF421 family)
MDKSLVHLDDIHRILFGNAPAEFMLEVAIRTIITYIALLVIVKWLGKRMSGQLTITELAISIMLGAIIAPPMESPERGIVQGIMILMLVLIFHQTISFWSVRNQKTERLTQGQLSIFVKNGVMQLNEIGAARVSRAQIFEALREQDIFNLGKVKRLYMEPKGTFTVFQYKESRQGLSLLPVGDDEIHTIQKKAGSINRACISCGNIDNLEENKDADTCPVCGGTQWDAAVLS